MNENESLQSIEEILTEKYASHKAEHSHHAHPHKTSFVLTTPIAIIISGALIACGLVGYGLITRGSSVSTALPLFAGRAIDETVDYVEGNPKSDVVLVEYSDPECPFCGQVHSTMKEIRDSYKGKIAFVYRHFPLTQIHQHAFNEAKSIECVGKLAGAKKYYEYIDALFGYKLERKSMQIPQNAIQDLSKSVGVENTSFLACMKEEALSKKIEQSIDDGIAAGVQGTPSSFVLVKTRRGYEVIGQVDGARPYAYFKALIDQALSK